jgi:hypothetical protein
LNPIYSSSKYLVQPQIINRLSLHTKPAKGRRGAYVFARAKTNKQLTISDCQVGFPIRTSRDQRVLSPPPGLSQSATSFIASCCQGIHQTPLSRLIRSRRRQALLREVVQPQPAPSWSEVLTRTHPLGRRRAGSRALNDLSTRQDPRSVSFDLERLLSLQRTRKSPARRLPHSASARTASRVLLSSRCQYLVVSLARSDRKAHVHEPANRIEEGTGGSRRS